MKKASGVDIPYAIKPRREGDVAEVYADCRVAKEELDWVATRDLDTMCKLAFVSIFIHQPMFQLFTQNLTKLLLSSKFVIYISVYVFYVFIMEL